MFAHSADRFFWSTSGADAGAEIAELHCGNTESIENIAKLAWGL
jgi:hypothetical protein